MPTFEHKAQQWKFIIKDLRQIDLEVFERALQAIARKGLFEEHGATVRSAYTAGWVIEPAKLDVDQEDPRFVRWLAKQINDHYVELNTIPIDPE